MEEEDTLFGTESKCKPLVAEGHYRCPESAQPMPAPLATNGETRSGRNATTLRCRAPTTAVALSAHRPARGAAMVLIGCRYQRAACVWSSASLARRVRLPPSSTCAYGASPLAPACGAESIASADQHFCAYADAPLPLILTAPIRVAGACGPNPLCVRHCGQK